MITWTRWLRRRRPTPTPLPDVATYAEVLAAYAEANTRANDALKEKRRLRALVDQLPEGRWGGWRKSFGSSARIVDVDRVRELLLERGLEVPMKDGQPRLEVTYVGGGQ